MLAGKLANVIFKSIICLCVILSVSTTLKITVFRNGHLFFVGLIHQASFNLPSASFYSLCLSVLQRLCRLIDRLSPGLFQNSPLYQYLHDLGHTDFEACPTSKEEEEEEYGLEGDFASDRERQKTLVSVSVVGFPKLELQRSRCDHRLIYNPRWLKPSGVYLHLKS